ncbi:MAG: DUF4229 domain-containing protein [Marmoricola sp.]
MKPFVIYTLLRLGLFVATYAVLGALWVLFRGTEGVLLAPFLLAVVVSSVLSVKLLRGHRDRFAAVVQARAERATARFEQVKSREDEK